MNSRKPNKGKLAVQLDEAKKTKRAPLTEDELLLVIIPLMDIL